MDAELPPEPDPAPQPAQEITPASPPALPASPNVVASPIEAVQVTAAPLPVGQPPSEQPSSQIGAYTDRSTGLVLSGVFQIILGLLCALMVPLAAFGAFISRLGPGGGVHPGQFISGIAVYAFVAVALVCLGIGSIQTKRWARALTLVISWYWLVCGALATVLLTAVLPVAMRTLLQAQPNNSSGASPEMTAGVMAVMLTIMIVFVAFFLIVVPIAFIVFYSRRDVAETCRHRDPIERWTDRTPLPVLGASVVIAIHVLYLVLVGVTMPMFPFFGRYLYGIVGAACFLLTGAVDAYLAVAFYRLQSAGWWIAAVLTPIRLLSTALTFAHADLLQAYSKMGMTDEQLRVLNSSPFAHSHVTLWWNLLSAVILYGYMLWLKRFFKTPAATQQPEPLPVHAG